MDKVASLVPEIYYDLIARVIPGLILFVMLAMGPAGTSNMSQSVADVFPTVLVLLFSYALGFILDTFSGTFLDWPNRGVFRIFSLVYSKDLEVWKTDVWDVIASERNDARAATLKKMMAERAFLRNVLVVSLALWLLDFGPIVYLPAAAKAALVAVLAIVYYRWEFWVHLRARSAVLAGRSKLGEAGAVEV